MNKVVLNAIVKNESKIIKRLLDSCKNLIDYISICDTGSTDNTVEVIYDWIKENDFPQSNCKIHQPKRSFGEILFSFITIDHNEKYENCENLRKELNEWKSYAVSNNQLNIYNDILECVETLSNKRKLSNEQKDLIYDLLNSQDKDKPLRHKEDTTFVNFGQNRDQSLRLARKYFPEATYTFLIDADMIVHTNNFNKSMLIGNSIIFITQVFGVKNPIEYSYAAFIHKDSHSKCVGVTHEYWSYTSREILPKDTIHITSPGDGGCKSNKQERDERMLKGEIFKTKEIVYEGFRKKTVDFHLNDSLRTRYYFYLAETYRCMKKYKESISYYTKRIHKERYRGDSEVWYSIYSIANIYKYMYNSDRKYESNMVDWYLKLYEYEPRRIESYRMLYEFYKSKNQINRCYMFAKLLITNEFKYTPNDLFVNTKLYDLTNVYKYLIENSYKMKDKKTGNLACEKLLKESSDVSNQTFVKKYLEVYK